MFTVSVSHDSLKALALIAAKEDVRFYLKTVCVDLTTEGRVHLVSCDGHRLLIVGNAKLEGSRVARRFLIPCEALKGVKPVNKRDPITIEITPKGLDSGTFVIRGNVTVSGDLVVANYPEWPRILPVKRTVATMGELAHFNLGYLGEFQRVAELMGCKYPRIVHNGESSALVSMGADAFGVIMPMRIGSKEDTTTFVDWLEPVAAPALQVAA